MENSSSNWPNLAGAGHNRWEGLTRFIDDGRIEIDSNTVERSIKPIGLGKNYLFAGSEGGAETWATLASLINTAKLHDIDPRHYLTDVLERIVSGRTKINRSISCTCCCRGIGRPSTIARRQSSPPDQFDGRASGTS